MADFFLGIDVGTSGTKALLLGGGGETLLTATAEHPIYFPKPGWSEQNPDDWWTSTCQAVRTVLNRAGSGKKTIAGIGLSGQMHGSVFLDKQNRPLCNALLWNDQRTANECAEIERRAGGRAALIRMVNNVALTGYTAPKILWLRNNRPSVFRRVRTVVLPKDYINYRLTGERRCEVSDAAGTLLLDVRRRQWSQTLVEKLELDPALFPAMAESPDVIGTLTTEAATVLGLKAGIPVVAGAGDQAAAAVGTGVVKRGVVSATMGTSGVVFAYSDKPVPNRQGMLQSFCHAVPGTWCVFGCMLSAGGSLQWLREVLYADRLADAADGAARDMIYTEMITEAATAKPNDTLLFHPYLTGERCPYPHPHARGAFVGLTRRHQRGDIVRAVLEGITLGMNRQIEIMRRLGIETREVRLAGGGARNAWWRQLQADVYGARCTAMHSEEGSALGAAILAAVGAGQYKTVPAACQQIAKVKFTHKPQRSRTKRYQELMHAAAKTYETLEPYYHAEL
ncbi:MAG: xylulokinase [Phycisphaerae bacterium]|nr:xylulokinase [Phycisphaerae bacterium]